MQVPAAGTHAQLHSKFLQLKCHQRIELIGVFYHTQVDDFPLSDCTVSPAPPSLEKLYFWKMNTIVTHWSFILQLAATDNRDTHFFFLPVPFILPLFPSL